MTELLVTVCKVVFVLGFTMSLVPFLVWMERRICAFIQDRVGPNRVGPIGLLQPIADSIKLMFKEDIIPAGVDKFVYLLGPFLAVLPPILIFAVIPFAKPLEIDGKEYGMAVVSSNAGLLIFMALASGAVYGVAFGGWASNNKYSLLGGLRSSAQLISYEIIFGLAIATVFLLANTMDPTKIVENQMTYGWNIVRQPVAAFLLFVASLAENKRLPFDLPEAEAELVAGYHTEYSGMKYAMFMMGEYIAITSMSALFTVLFLGGWHIPFVPQLQMSAGPLWEVALSFGVFFAKIMSLIFVIMWIRWTFPRYRYNELMKFSWKTLLPVAMVNFFVTSIIVVL